MILLRVKEFLYFKCFMLFLCLMLLRIFQYSFGFCFVDYAVYVQFFVVKFTDIFIHSFCTVCRPCLG